MFNKVLMAAGLIALFAITGCKEEGCTDPNATNFNSDADTNDGSCVFEGSVVFWYGANAAQGLLDFGSTSLTYFVDGQVVGSSAADVFWTASPDCGQNASITVTKNLGNATNLSFTYRVQDQDADVIWEGVANFTANTCVATELVW